jgi:hypothetical protein
MYVFCVYPAMSKKSENLSDLDKKDRNKRHSSPFINVVKGVFFMVCVTLVPVSYLSAPSAVDNYRVPGKFIRIVRKVYSSSTNKAKIYSYSIFVQQMYWLQDKTLYLHVFYTGCTNISAPLSSLSGCQLTSDCQGVECCNEVEFLLGSRNVYATFKLTQCDEMDTTIERKSWIKHGLDSIKGFFYITNYGSAIVYDIWLWYVAESRFQIHPIVTKETIFLSHVVDALSLIDSESWYNFYLFKI